LAKDENEYHQYEQNVNDNDNELKRSKHNVLGSISPLEKSIAIDLNLEKNSPPFPMLSIFKKTINVKKMILGVEIWICIWVQI